MEVVKKGAQFVDVPECLHWVFLIVVLVVGDSLLLAVPQPLMAQLQDIIQAVTNMDLQEISNSWYSSGMFRGLSHIK